MAGSGELERDDEADKETEAEEVEAGDEERERDLCELLSVFAFFLRLPSVAPGRSRFGRKEAEQLVQLRFATPFCVPHSLHTLNGI